MSDFKTTTHFKNWLMTPDQLNAKLDAKTLVILEKFQTCINFSQGNGLSYKGETAVQKSKNLFIGGIFGANSKNPKREFQIWEEKLLAVIFEKLVKFVLFKTVDIEGTYTDEVQIKIMSAFAQASVYLHRYYLNQSVLDVDPQKMIYACLFLAWKSEELGEFQDKFCQMMKQDPIQLELAYLETELLHQLNFEVDVLTPIPGLNSLMFRLEDALSSSQTDRIYLKGNQDGNLSDPTTIQQGKELLNKFLRSVRNHIIDSFKIRELVFCESGSYVALACFEQSLLSETNNLQFFIRDPATGERNQITTVKQFVNHVYSEKESPVYRNDDFWTHFQTILQQLNTQQQQSLDIQTEGKRLAKRIQKIQQLHPEFMLNLRSRSKQQMIDGEPSGCWGEEEEQGVQQIQPDQRSDIMQAEVKKVKTVDKQPGDIKQTNSSDSKLKAKIAGPPLFTEQSDRKRPVEEITGGFKPQPDQKMLPPKNLN